MKITKINVEAKAVKLKEPITIALGTIEHSMSAIVEIETDEGIKGYGEGSPGILITGETLKGTTECIQLFEKQLIGVDPLDIEKVHSIMNTVAAHAPSAKTAIDIACYDLLGKKANLPVYKLLGGYASSVKTDLTIGIDTPEIMAVKAKQAVSLGFDTLKIKVGTTISQDLARIEAIRLAVGSQIKLRLDANQGWQPKEAVTMINRLEEFGIELVEQPVAYHDIDGLAFVTKQVAVPIMSDESCFNSKDALRLIKARAVDYVNIKLMKCGGIHEALKINSICEAAGVECMIGCMVEETNIGVTAAAHLAAATKNITRADLDATFGLHEVAIPGGVGLEATSMITLTNQGGLGLSK
ncbi:dipeptide epimerase [Enterococcus termitis]|uniref:Dipeptide epimerase n=1 Tax=Enterococcus termitis TaxID=332950 RepID=A0A1E5GZ56_9ENTE|nr:dipeptide epimerase [Enterococcus termitis]OEG17855.1 dipeptide epimerase [Enterococcus termitis]OJG97021.1 O-succinylbenzoate synthase [Enterococcus termitis]